MSHFHMNERIDDGSPVNNGTDRHRDCLADALLASVPALHLLGWKLEDWEISGINGNSLATFSYTDECVTHTMTMMIWECSCESGERTLVIQERRSNAHLN